MVLDHIGLVEDIGEGWDVTIDRGVRLSNAAQPGPEGYALDGATRIFDAFTEETPVINVWDRVTTVYNMGNEYRGIIKHRSDFCTLSCCISNGGRGDQGIGWG